MCKNRSPDLRIPSPFELRAEAPDPRIQPGTSLWTTNRSSSQIGCLSNLVWLPQTSLVSDLLGVLCVRWPSRRGCHSRPTTSVASPHGCFFEPAQPELPEGRPQRRVPQSYPAHSSHRSHSPAWWLVARPRSRLSARQSCLPGGWVAALSVLDGLAVSLASITSSHVLHPLPVRSQTSRAPPA